MKILLALLLGCSSAFCQITLYVSPNSVNMTSGQTQQFTVTDLTTNKPASANWYSCASNAITNTGLFTAPVVTTKSSICVYAISTVDPSKSSTSYAMISPTPLASCPTKTIWSSLAAGTYYSLPSWVTALTWVQPADLLYQAVKNSTPLSTKSTVLPPVGGGTYTYCDPGLLVQGGTPPYIYVGQNLPPGLTVNSTTGTYGGSATAPGYYTNIIFCATDSKGIKVCLAPRSQQVCNLGIIPCNGS